MEEALSILKEHRLSVTGVRKRILEAFLRSGEGLAHNDLEAQGGGQMDRVTVYRTLQAFLEKGIIHTIPTADNSVKYALCSEACRDGHHHDDHVHFICEVCGRTTCINEVHVPRIQLPRGYRIGQMSMVVSGTCPSCS
jgi:Fur family ferric uptake transcriptional regulator